jgi:hypothetical protein
MSVSLERPTRITELDAVNLMLRAIGETPVSSLGPTAKPTAVKAQQILGERSLVVQSEGWNFVVEQELKLEPNSLGEIYLPENIASLEPAGRSQFDSLVERGGRLYDNSKSTFQFTSSVVVRAVLALPFSDLPQPARWYIAVLSALALINEEQPGGAAMRITSQDLSEAKNALERYDRRLRKGGLRRHNPHFRRTRGSR